MSLRPWKRFRNWAVLVLLLLAFLMLTGCQPLQDLGNAMTDMFSGLVNSLRFPEFPTFR